MAGGIELSGVGVELVDLPGTGTVTSVSVTTSHGVSGVVATATTTPAITLTLGPSTNIAPATATPANGSTSARMLFGTTAGFGIYYGSGAPTVTAAKGSWYLRSDGSGVNDRGYINTDGGTTWTAMVTVA